MSVFQCSSFDAIRLACQDSRPLLPRQRPKMHCEFHTVASGHEYHVHERPSCGLFQASRSMPLGRGYFARLHRQGCPGASYGGSFFVFWSRPRIGIKYSKSTNCTDDSSAAPTMAMVDPMLFGCASRSGGSISSDERDF